MIPPRRQVRTHCSRDGWVVDSRPLPTDPVEHDAEGLPKLGCNNLECRGCGQKVRTLANHTLRHVVGCLGDWRELYEQLAASPLVMPSNLWRLHVCHCAYDVQGGEAALDDAEGILPASQRLWHCGSHPVVELPHTFDGLAVSSANLLAVVADALQGRLPEAVRVADRREGVWLARLVARLEGTSDVARVVDAVAAALPSPDVLVRLRALGFFQLVPSDHAPRMRCEALLRDHGDLFVGVPDPRSGHRGTLDEQLWRAATDELPRDGALRTLAREFAFDPSRACGALFLGLGRSDAPWLAANAAAIARDNPAHRESLQHAVRVLGLGAEVGREVERAAAGDRGARLLAVLRDVRACVARPDGDYTWTSWVDQADALREIDGWIRDLGEGRRSSAGLGVLFAPTGPLQELAMSSGWANEFRALADRFDEAVGPD